MTLNIKYKTINPREVDQLLEQTLDKVTQKSFSLQHPFSAAIAVAGDSIANESITTSAGAIRKRPRGPICWANALLGQPWDLQLSDNYAIGGTTSEHLLNVQVPLILAAKAAGRNYTHCYISCGTNDYTVSTLSAASTLSNLEQAFIKLLEVGITPIHTGVRPRGVDVSAQDYKTVAKSVNVGLKELAAKGLVVFVDCTEMYADNSTAFGNILTTTSYDNLHPNSFGALLEGRLLKDYLEKSGITPALKFATTQDDVFNRTLNPFGCIGAISGGAITANPLLQGGTTAPTGMATAGGTWSKVNRTLLNGQVRSDPRVTLAASASHTLTNDCLATGAFTASQLQPGDVLEGVALVKLGNGATATGINQLTLTLTQNDGVVTLDHADLWAQSGDTVAYPLVGTEFVWLKTPKITISAYGGSGNHLIRSRLNIGTTAAGAGTVDVLAFECRRVL
jgi:hypothetical protein